MNDDTRIFLRQAGTLILSAAIGGFIGGMLQIAVIIATV